MAKSETGKNNAGIKTIGYNRTNRLANISQYFRPHMALDGKTPAEKCGIIIEGENKWKTVIQNTSSHKKR